jgi:hypothetical protein
LIASLKNFELEDFTLLSIFFVSASRVAAMMFVFIALIMFFDVDLGC